MPPTSSIASVEPSRGCMGNRNSCQRTGKHSKRKRLKTSTVDYATAATAHVPLPLLRRTDIDFPTASRNCKLPAGLNRQERRCGRLRLRLLRRRPCSAVPGACPNCEEHRLPGRKQSAVRRSEPRQDRPDHCRSSPQNRHLDLVTAPGEQLCRLGLLVSSVGGLLSNEA